MRPTERRHNILLLTTLSWLLAVFLCSAAPFVARAHAQPVSGSAAAPQMIVQESHADEIVSVAISPDGSRFVTAERGGPIRFWDLRSGNMLRTVLIRPGGMRPQIGFTSDGSKVAMIDEEGSFLLLAWQSGEPSRTVDRLGHSSTFAFAGKAPLVALGDDVRSVSLWNWRTGKMLHFVITNLGNVQGLALSDDGSLLACIGEESATQHPFVEIWNTETESRVYTLHTGNSVSTAAFSPDKKSIALGMSGFSNSRARVELWDLTRGARTRQLPADTSAASSMAYSEDGSHVVMADEAGIVRVWDTAHGRLLKTSGKYSALAPTTVSANGRFAAVAPSFDAVRVYEALTGKLAIEMPGSTHVMHQAIACNAGRTLITGGIRRARNAHVGELLFWDLQTGICTGSLQWSEAIGYGDVLAASPDGHYVAAAGDDKAAVWDVPAGRLIATCALPSNEKKRIMEIALSPDGRFLAIAGRKPNPVEPAPIYGEGHRVFPAGYGRSAVPREIGFLEIWSVADHARLHECLDVTSIPRSIAFSRDGKTLTGKGIGIEVAMWDASTGALLKRYLGSPDSLDSGNAKPASVLHGTALASLDRIQCLRICDAVTGKLKATLRPLNTPGGFASPVEWFASTPDGYYAGSRRCDTQIRWRVGDEVVGPTRYRTEHKRPDLVQGALTRKGETAR